MLISQRLKKSIGIVVDNNRSIGKLVSQEDFPILWNSTFSTILQNSTSGISTILQNSTFENNILLTIFLETLVKTNDMV